MPLPRGPPKEKEVALALRLPVPLLPRRLPAGMLLLLLTWRPAGGATWPSFEYMGRMVLK